MKQIGIIGGMHDIVEKGKGKSIAEELGRLMAKQGICIVYGYESDGVSLPMQAANASFKAKGITIAVCYGKKKENIPSTFSIFTGAERGGGREFVLINSCDAVISIGGGSGTLMEISMAYQAGIPVIAIEGSGGWSEKLSGTFLDERQREKILTAKNPEEAVRMACHLLK
jgi:uncharacterized protein (TIGR00725 family)